MTRLALGLLAAVSVIAIAGSNAAGAADAPAEGAAKPPASGTISAPAAMTATDANASNSASIFVNGNLQADACARAAQWGDASNAGADQCTQVLSTPTLSDHDKAATYVDRGAIYLQHRKFALAQADFELAMKIAPDLGNAYVNHGAAMIGLKRYADGIADIDKGLPLKPDQPEKAYFNRAIADEALGDKASAMADYQKASALQPNWAAPKAELARFARIAAAGVE
jgi:tetratricopeptide (TPR) repeat protein